MDVCRIKTQINYRRKKMAKAKVNPKLIEAAESTPPKNPAPSAADRTYLRGLRRRGYTEDEIKVVAQKAGLLMPPDLFVPRKKPAPKA